MLKHEASAFVSVAVCAFTEGLESPFSFIGSTNYHMLILSAFKAQVNVSAGG